MLREDFEKAADAIYATVETGAWPDALDRIAGVVDRDASVLLGFENVETLNGRHVANSRIDPGAVRTFCDACKDHGTEFFSNVLPDMPLGELRPLSRYFQPDAFRSTPVYDGVIGQPLPEEELFAVLHRSATHSVLFGVVNTSVRGAFAHEDRAALAALVPHLCRAARVQHWLARSAAHGLAIEQALEASALATLLLDGDGEIVLANAAAEAVLEQGDGIGVHCGILQLVDAGARARCARLLAQAARRPAAFDDNDVLVVPRPSGRLGYVLRVTPLPVPRCAHAGPAIRAAVTISDPALTSPLDSRRLETALSLTPAEARVAAAFAAAGGISETAATLSISVNTVKTHLSQILTKTGTHRQADLMRLLMQLARALRP